MTSNEVRDGDGDYSRADHLEVLEPDETLKQACDDFAEARAIVLHRARLRVDAAFIRCLAGNPKTKSLSRKSTAKRSTRNQGSP